MRKLLIAAASAVLVSGAAHAVPTMLLTVSTTDNVNELTCNMTVGGSPVCSFTMGGGSLLFATSAGPNAFVYQGSMGGWNFSFSTASTNAPGLATGANLGMSFGSLTKDVGTTASKALEFSLSGNGFTMPTGPLIAMGGSVNVTQGLASGVSANGTFSAKEDGGVALPITSPDATASCVGAVNGSLFGCGISPQEWLRGTSPTFSLQQVITFNMTAGAQGLSATSTVNATNAVPEPMTSALVGLGLFGAAYFSRRRAAKLA